MIEFCRIRGTCRGCCVSIACLVGASLVAGCSDLKQMVGLDPTMPDEFAVESRAPLTIPPEFDLRPPAPGAPRPQEKTAEQQAQEAIEQAGPGTSGNQASDLRLHSAENGLPTIGTGAQSPDAAGAVGSQSLASKLLDYGDTGNAGATVDKRATTPLKGVY